MKSTRAYKEIASYESKPEPRFNKVVIVDTSEVDLFISETILNALHVAREAVSYTHLRAHETVLDLVCRLLLEKKKKKK